MVILKHPRRNPDHDLSELLGCRVYRRRSTRRASAVNATRQARRAIMFEISNDMISDE